VTLILRHLEGKGMNWKKITRAAAELYVYTCPINTG
jgi:hypothetical protein